MKSTKKVNSCQRRLEVCRVLVEKKKILFGNAAVASIRCL